MVAGTGRSRWLLAVPVAAALLAGTAAVPAALAQDHNPDATIRIGSLYEPQNLDNTAGAGQGIRTRIDTPRRQVDIPQRGRGRRRQTRHRRGLRRGEVLDRDQQAAGEGDGLAGEGPVDHRPTGLTGVP